MKKIMFSDRYGLTQAVLEGRKTMTRRIIGQDIEVDWNRRGKVHLPIVGYKHRMLWMDCTEFLPDSGKFDYVAPQKYQPAYDWDEEVAVAQCYKDIDHRGIVAYEDASDIQPGMIRPISAHESAGWKNKMFVRADLMPEIIRITDIKAEHLQDITDEECLKEGVEKWLDCYIVSGIMEKSGKNNVCFDTPREAFASLIDRISGKGTWDSNPWVWAYSFELLKDDL
jgi:hypothetical protein